MIDVVRPEDLDALGSEAIRVVHAFPRRARLRLAPSQIAGRGRGEWHTEIGPHAGRKQFAAHIPRIDGDWIAGDWSLDDLRVTVAKLHVHEAGGAAASADRESELRPVRRLEQEEELLLSLVPNLERRPRRDELDLGSEGRRTGSRRAGPQGPAAPDPSSPPRQAGRP